MFFLLAPLPALLRPERFQGQIRKRCGNIVSQNCFLGAQRGLETFAVEVSEKIQKLFFPLEKKFASAAKVSCAHNGVTFSKTMFQQQRFLNLSFAIVCMTTLNDIYTYILEKVYLGLACAEYSIECRKRQTME